MYFELKAITVTGIAQDCHVKAECPECLGAGFIPKMYPSGHTEAYCVDCSGKGWVEAELDCECGAHVINSNTHADWCPLYRKDS